LEELEEEFLVFPSVFVVNSSEKKDDVEFIRVMIKDEKEEKLIVT